MKTSLDRFFHAWDTLTLPTSGHQYDNYKEQMKERRAYFISRLLLLVVIVDIAALFIEAKAPGPYHVIFVSTFALVFFFGIATCNRLGWVMLSGWGLLVVITGALSSVVFLHIPLKLTDLPLLCLLCVSEVFAGLLLPPLMICAVALFNCLLVILALYFLPLTEPVKVLLLQQPEGVFFPLLSLILEIGVGTYILVVSLSREVYRASYAQKLAQLQAEREQERQRLRNGVTTFAAVLTSASKGDLDARVTMHEGEVLWEMAAPLNALLNQAKVWKARDSQLEQAVTGIVSYLERLRDQPYTTPPSPSGTAADHIIRLIQERRASDDLED